MKRSLIAILVTACTILVIFVGMVMAADKMGQMKDNMMTDGAALWSHVSKDMPYSRWKLWPGTSKMQKGAEPHGALVTIYINEAAGKTIADKTGRFDSGAIVLKENYMSDKTLAAITLMYKANGYNPDAGDWFWVKYGPDGSVDKEGKVGGCINCHSAKADNDWVFIGEIK